MTQPNLTRRAFFASVPAAVAGSAAAPLAGKPAAGQRKMSAKELAEQERFRRQCKATRDNLPCEEAFLVALREVLASIDGVLNAHAQDGCDEEQCDFCSGAWKLQPVVRLCESVICCNLSWSEKLDLVGVRKPAAPPRMEDTARAGERFILALLEVRDVADEVVDGHGLECPCHFCRDVDAFGWLLGEQAQLLGSLIVPTRAMLEKQYGKSA